MKIVSDNIVLRVVLDLDSQLIETPIRIASYAAVEAVLDLQRAKCFGLVGTGRLCLAFDSYSSGLQPFTTLVEMFAKSGIYTDSAWVPNPIIAELWTVPSNSTTSAIYERLPRLLDDLLPCNRGPALALNRAMAVDRFRANY